MVDSCPRLHGGRISTRGQREGVGLGGWGWLEEGGEGTYVFQLGEVDGSADGVFGALAAQGLGGQESEFVLKLLTASSSLEVSPVVGGGLGEGSSVGEGNVDAGAGFVGILNVHSGSRK